MRLKFRLFRPLFRVWKSTNIRNAKEIYNYMNPPEYIVNSWNISILSHFQITFEYKVKNKGPVELFKVEEGDTAEDTFRKRNEKSSLILERD